MRRAEPGRMLLFVIGPRAQERDPHADEEFLTRFGRRVAYGELQAPEAQIDCNTRRAVRGWQDGKRLLKERSQRSA